MRHVVRNKAPSPTVRGPGNRTARTQAARATVRNKWTQAIYRGERFTSERATVTVFVHNREARERFSRAMVRFATTCKTRLLPDGRSELVPVAAAGTVRLSKRELKRRGLDVSAELHESFSASYTIWAERSDLAGFLGYLAAYGILRSVEWSAGAVGRNGTGAGELPAVPSNRPARPKKASPIVAAPDPRLVRSDREPYPFAAGAMSAWPYDGSPVWQPNR